MKKTRAKKIKVRTFYHLQNLLGGGGGVLPGWFLSWAVFVLIPPFVFKQLAYFYTLTVVVECCRIVIGCCD